MDKFVSGFMTALIIMAAIAIIGSAIAVIAEIIYERGEALFWLIVLAGMVGVGCVGGIIATWVL